MSSAFRGSVASPLAVLWTPNHPGEVGRIVSAAAHTTRRRKAATDAGAVGAPINSADAWSRLADWLPEMLSELLESEVYGINQRPPKDQRGVYLFTERGKHLYVGRTGITARSRASGGPPITSFRHRFDQHTQLGRPPGASSFANRLMRNAARRRGVEIPSEWWKDRHAASAEAYGLFCAAKTRIGAMECRVVAFDDDLKGVRSSVAEIYVHAQLNTRFNDFSTS